MHSQQRHATLLSPASVVMLLLVFCVLGVALWFYGGSIFNPGPLSAKSISGLTLGSFNSHAEFETQCQNCHQPFQTDQAQQCMACHKDIADQLDQAGGMHGRLSNPRLCAACHLDHKGRQFDPGISALSSFDHSRTNFPLTGKHGMLGCKHCHTDNTFNATATECAACHKEPTAHAGLYGNACADCHTSFDWQPATLQGQVFNHNQARFSLARHTLNFDQTPMACTACHADGNQMQSATANCSTCHTLHDAPFMAKHTQQYGKDCLLCHDGVDRLHHFDHQQVFALTGKHAGLQCTDCHKNNQYRNTPARCDSCHKEPTLHAGFFGTRCDYCHSNRGWRPAPLQAHTFPLDHGGKGEVSCTTCHLASYGQNRCDTCHEHAADVTARSHASLNLAPAELDRCVQCHLDGKVKR